MDTLERETRTRSMLAYAVRSLAELDSDQARIENGVGFSRVDVRFGHLMADRPVSAWTPRQTRATWEMLRRYAKTQLPRLGIDFAKIPEPPVIPVEQDRAHGSYGRVVTVAPSKIVTHDGLLVFIFDPNDPQFHEKKTEVKTFSGARYDGDRRWWTAPASVSNLGAVVNLIDRYADTASPWTFGPELLEEIDARVSALATVMESSHAKESDYHVYGIRDGLTLYPFQVAGVEFAVKRQRFINADDMGLGKTPQAIASIADQSAFPALIVAPSNLKLNWKKEIARWCENAAYGKNGPIVYVCSGSEPTGIPEPVDIVVINYDVLGDYDTKKKQWIGKKLAGGKIARGWGSLLSEIKWEALVCDEAHMLKNRKSQRFRAMSEIVRATDPTIVELLSGTPYKSRPEELWALIELTGRGNVFGGFMPYMRRYCQAAQETVYRKNQPPKLVWNFSGAANLSELNDILRSEGLMIRRRKKDVLGELPPRAYRSVALAMDPTLAKKYRQVEADVASWIATNKAADAVRIASWEKRADELRTFGDDREAFLKRQRYEYVHSETMKQRKSERLARFNTLRQLCWQAKKAEAFAWIDNFLDSSDESLVIFGWHRETVSEIADRYEAPKIMGGMTPKAVEDAKEKFQEKRARVIVCNIAAGSVGHTLTAASNVAFVEFAWTPGDMDQSLDRVHRIGTRDLPCIGWLLTASDEDEQPTIDDEMADIITEKREIVLAGTDGAGEIAQIKVFAELQRRMAVALG